MEFGFVPSRSQRRSRVLAPRGGFDSPGRSALVVIHNIGLALKGRDSDVTTTKYAPWNLAAWGFRIIDDAFQG